MRDWRVGGGTLADGHDADAATPAPGKQTLVGDMQLAQGGMATSEGGQLFSGPDPAMTATIPSVATPDKKTDKNYEDSMGVTKAITDKAMVPVDGVNGKSFVAKGIAGHKDGTVTFTFDRAFLGTYDYAAAGKKVLGVHVAISAALAGCGEHKDVKLIQVLRNFTKTAGAVTAADPGTAKRRERSGTSDANAKSKGWRVDGLDSDTTPFYVSDDLYGNHGSDTEAAKLRDTPGNWDTDRNVGKEFRTCAVSYANGAGVVLACVDWGYYIDDAGKASFYPATPTAYAGAVSELTDAAARWDGIAGNTKANLKP
ncbi:MAG TPA: hypothetical protein VH143_05245 [Kofleriaceae bacterium]|jgi:hypothetical protein|nr:hypothetical protein [Kofleriaceae bacterium]